MVSRKDAAEFLKCSLQTVTNYVKSGLLKGHVILPALKNYSHKGEKNAVVRQCNSRKTTRMFFHSAADAAIKKIVSCRMVIRALGDGSVSGVPMGATQGSMSALGYSQSWTISGGGSSVVPYFFCGSSICFFSCDHKPSARSQ